MTINTTTGLIAYASGETFRDGSAAGWLEGLRTLGSDAAAVSGSPSASRLMANGPRSDRRLSARIIFAGSGADNDQVNYKIWHARMLRDETRAQFKTAGRALMRPIGTGVITLGTAIEAASSGVFSAEAGAVRIADTLTFTADSGWFAGQKAAFGTEDAQVLSPGSNGAAELLLPDVFNADAVAIEFWSDNAAKRGAALVELMT